MVDDVVAGTFYTDGSQLDAHPRYHGLCAQFGWAFVVVDSDGVHWDEDTLNFAKQVAEVLGEGIGEVKSKIMGWVNDKLEPIKKAIMDKMNDLLDLVIKPMKNVIKRVYGWVKDKASVYAAKLPVLQQAPNGKLF